jgi:hypothetical protein
MEELHTKETFSWSSGSRITVALTFDFQGGEDVKPDRNGKMNYDSAEKRSACFDKLSMNGKSPMISTAPPFVLRLSKDERKVFSKNQTMRSGLGLSRG